MSDTYFRNKVTGLVTLLPSHYKDHPSLGANLVEVDPSEANCVDCGFDEPAPEKPVEKVVVLDEPAPIPAVRRAKKD